MKRITYDTYHPDPTANCKRPPWATIFKQEVQEATGGDTVEALFTFLLIPIWLRSGFV